MGSQQSAFAAIANLILGTNENEDKEIDIQRLKELKRPADLEEAKRFRLNNSIIDKETDRENPKLYSVWSTSPESFAKYGVGIELYFLFLKQMTILFSIVAALSIIPMVMNSYGEFISEDESQNGSRFSLANSWSYDQDLLDLYTKNNNGTEIYAVILNETDINHILKRSEEQYEWVWITDALITSIFLISLLAFLIVNKIKINHNVLGNDSVSEYSIEIEGLPKEGITEMDVENHFNRFGEIHEVYLGRSYGDLLYFFKQKAEVKKEIRAHKIFLGISSSFYTDDRKMEKLRKKKTKLNEHISLLNLNKKHNELDVHKAYIIFNTKEARAKALREHWKGFFGLQLNKDPQLKYKNDFQLKPRTCTDPSDIMWENLEINHIEKKSRKIFSITITLIFMALSVGLIFLMRRKKLIDYDSYSCIHMNVDTDLNVWEVKQSNMTSDEILCWCRKRTTDDWFKPAVFSECKTYALKRLSAGIINFFICVGIVVVNYSLRLLLTTLSEFERHKSYNIKQTHTLLKIFFAMLFNTVLVPILTHIDWSGKNIGTEVTDQQFSDFEKLWYVKVGSIFSIMMCINVVSPHFIFNFLVLYMKGLYYRTKGYRKFKTQYEINNAFLGPVFVISTRTSMILTVLFTCFIFSGGIPLLNIIAFSALFTIYWTDKFLIIRHYRKPPQYSHHVYSSAIKLMPLCVLLHCCISLYAYGCPDVFPTGFVNNNYFDPLEMSIEDRIEMDHGKVFLILIIISFIMLILFIYSDKITKECKIGLLLRNHAKTKKFTEVKPVLEKYGLASYNLDKNPNYKPLLDSIDKDVSLMKIEPFQDDSMQIIRVFHDNSNNSDSLHNDSSDWEVLNKTLSNIVMYPPAKICDSDDPAIEDSSELTDMERSNLHEIELKKPDPVNMLEIPVVFGEISSMPSTLRLEDTTARSRNEPKIEEIHSHSISIPIYDKTI